MTSKPTCVGDAKPRAWCLFWDECNFGFFVGLDIFFCFVGAEDNIRCFSGLRRYAPDEALGRMVKVLWVMSVVCFIPA